ncbi:hypothetical protein HQ520_12375 [bacterium]|nr:hypothetical protein [bacterium]
MIGFQQATAVAKWVFQTDSDGEIGAAHFTGMWALREDFDLLLGVRVGRLQTVRRRFISRGLRLVTRLLFGVDARDINVPFRLMRTEALARLLPLVPADAFAPNAIMTGLAARLGLRIKEVDVPHQAGQGRRGADIGWRSIARAMIQTTKTAWRAR